jgi:hypothetical protein
MAARFDLTSDYMIFFISLFVVLAITVVALERYSPTRTSKRKVRRHTQQQSGDLID